MDEDGAARGPDSAGRNDGSLGQRTVKREDNVLDTLEDRPLFPGGVINPDLHQIDMS